MSDGLKAILSDLIELIAIDSQADGLTYGKLVERRLCKIQSKIDGIAGREPVMIVHRIASNVRLLNFWNVEPGPDDLTLVKRQLRACIAIVGGEGQFFHLWLTRLPIMRIFDKGIELRCECREGIRTSSHWRWVSVLAWIALHLGPCMLSKDIGLPTQVPENRSGRRFESDDDSVGIRSSDRFDAVP